MSVPLLFTHGSGQSSLWPRTDPLATPFWKHEWPVPACPSLLCSGSHEHLSVPDQHIQQSDLPACRESTAGPTPDWIALRVPSFTPSLLAYHNEITAPGNSRCSRLGRRSPRAVLEEWSFLEGWRQPSVNASLKTPVHTASATPSDPHT